MDADRVIVIGAGIGGLAAALDLAGRGFDVTVLERAAAPGGKMRRVAPGGRPIDAGPTVFTMRWVFDELFEGLGERLEDHLTLRPAETLARHAWLPEAGGGRLDLFTDIERSADAIGQFAGAEEARGYRRFCSDAREMFETLEPSFIRAAEPSMGALIRRAGPGGLGRLGRTRPFSTLWKTLGRYFKDPRLRQLFGRYTTYVGASPFAAPATLMLVAHVEQAGVWYVEGGMHRLAQVLADRIEARGGTVRYDTPVAEILTTGDRVSGVWTVDGEEVAAEAVIANADCSALGSGLFGRAAAAAAPTVAPAERSLSALTFLTEARTDGFPLIRHNVFFSSDYAREFEEILAARRLPGEPTVYVCAQDRGDPGDAVPEGAERLLVLVNAPPNGDSGGPPQAEIERCEATTMNLLARCGLTLAPEATARAGPATFEALFPATGGALYGRASHGWQASFQRPGVRTKLPGLYLAGGSVHPGPGVPMAALSGRLAAESLVQDRASTGRSRTAAMSGGISTR